MELAQKMEAEARLNLETEIDAGDAEDVKLCIRMQTPKFVTKVRRAKRLVPGCGGPMRDSSNLGKASLGPFVNKNVAYW